MDEKTKIILENALKQIEAQEAAAIETAIQKNYTEMVAPHNTALDLKKEKAIKEITDKYNSEIAQITKDVNASKVNFEKAQKETVSLTIRAEYSKIKENLKQQITG